VGAGQRLPNTDLNAIIDRYAERSETLSATGWAARGQTQRFLENLMRLAGQLL
jgi:hypothetical protein